MKKLLLVLIVLSALVVAGLLLLREYLGRAAPEVAPEVAPAATPDALTLRRIDAGEVLGFIDREGARAWLGMPYARPPVGDLRWRPPQPPAPWDGVREALAFGAVCPQKRLWLFDPDAAGDGVRGDEDCLTLNVWAPANAHELPVMLWLHGGGNSIGTGATYNGALLATEQNLVVVTINYRLGPLGWFAHPSLTTGSPLVDSGNYANLDIVRALEWTHDNIRAFGGDPDNVTVFGESAGGYNTLATLATPLARGLFHRAISQSGGYRHTTVTEASAFREDGGHDYSAREIVNRLLVQDGTVANRDAAVAYQRDMPPARLRSYLYGKSTAELLALWDDSRLGGMLDLPFNFADGAVLPELPTEAIFANPETYNPVPVMLGTNRDEPALFMAWDPHWTENFLWIFRRVKNPDAYLRAVRYGALAWKARGVDQLADAMAGAGNGRVFAYRFDWDEQDTVLGFDLGVALGAAHAMELPFVWGNFDLLPIDGLFPETEGRDALARSIRSYWAEFAYNGAPGRGREGDAPHWLPWGTQGKTSLLLDTTDGGGIRMMEERVSLEAVARQLATDPTVADEAERCDLFDRAFRWAGDANLQDLASAAGLSC